MALLHSIRETQSALAAIVSPEVRPTPRGESLERFLAGLSNRWRQDESASSQPEKVRAPRTWRTRPDPFEGVSCEVLEWLQSTHPGRFSRAHLCTRRCRVQKWRGTMASKLVYAALEETKPDQHSLAESVLLGGGSRS